MYTANMARTIDDMRTDKLKVGDSRVPIDMWYRRACTDQGVRVSKSFNIFW